MTLSPFRSLLLLPLIISAQAAEKTDDEGKSGNSTSAEMSEAKDVSRDGKVTIAGESVPYTATTGKLILRDKKGKPRASVFHTTYTRALVKNLDERPVMFAFNGGPGSSSVWLHLGILGPKRIDFPGDGTEPIEPPARLIENAFSLLDICDLVFIDPVSTGYSRAEGETNAKDFHGVESDIKSVGDFIRIWITENKRWASPKYLCGESYGGIRAAGLAEHLQNRYGMSLNGVVLLSSLLDYRTVFPSEGSQLTNQVYLPAFSSAAHFHGKIQGDRERFLSEAREFAFGKYGTALLKGNEISDTEEDEVAGELSRLTGISTQIWKREHLRISPSEFRSELLRAEGKVLGRFDARVAWDTTDPTSETPDYDPSYSLALGAFSTAMLSYLGNELGWEEDQPYEILTSVAPWDFGGKNGSLNMTWRLLSAAIENPKLRILVMGAHTDLATPAEGVAFSIRQAIGLPDEVRNRITYTEYDAGHMFYVNLPDLEKARKDLVEFLQAGR